jgi:adenylate cyclase
MHGDEEATMATLSACRAVVDELIAQHRGRIANTAGDNVLAEFTSVLDAVRCAIEIQASLQRANEDEPEGRRMHFRIGVNVGDVMVKDDDIFGDGVNVAARLEGLVKGGEICIFAGRARSPASSRRHGLRRFGRAAGQEHRALDPSVSPPHR